MTKVGGVVKLIDFGLAKKLPDGEETLRSAFAPLQLICPIPSTFYLNILSPTPRFPNTVPGTLKYACPENFRKYDQDGGQQVLPSSEELG